MLLNDEVNNINMETEFSQINIEKVENGFVISKQSISTGGIFGNKAQRFAPHIAKDEKEVNEIVNKMLRNIKSSLSILEEQNREEEDIEND